jgi:N-hydroxyarylamine O-acetyltransferase
MLNLSAYLNRIRYGGTIAPTRSVLEALHLAHATHIPFENLDIFLGKPIRLDLGSIQAKLVDQQRGGYCFEHNLLFAAVLREFGFDVLQLAARVRYRTTAILPRTHMLLLITVANTQWLADVGFGGEGLLLPVPFGNAAEVRHFSRSYRIVEADLSWLLQSYHGGTWRDLYAFTLEPQIAIDYEIANHYVSTHPDSRFVNILTVQLPAPGRRLILRDYELIEETGDQITQRTLTTDSELIQVMHEQFGLCFPPETKFRRPPVPA